MNRRLVLSLFLVLMLAILGACGNGDDEAETKEADSSEQFELPEPDLKDIPNVVADVNGQEISGDDFEATYVNQFQQVAMQSQMTGEEVDQDQLKSQIVEAMVGQKLLIQAADDGGFKASKEDVDKTLTELAQYSGLESKDEFITALEEQGMPEEEVVSEVEMQVKIDQLVASETGEIKSSDKELQEAYDELRAQQEEMNEDVDFPSFDEIKEDLAEQLKRQKEAEATQTLIEKLREDADITINI